MPIARKFAKSSQWFGGKIGGRAAAKIERVDFARRAEPTQLRGECGEQGFDKIIPSGDH